MPLLPGERLRFEVGVSYVAALSGLVLIGCAEVPPGLAPDGGRRDTSIRDDSSELDAPTSPRDTGPNDSPQPDAIRRADAPSPRDARATDAGFVWPLVGAEGVDWTINNYLDLDPTSGLLRDYMGRTAMGAKTYDGHDGVDIVVASFRTMDARVPIYAVAPGTVTHTVDGFDDRQTSRADGCGPRANAVYVRHENGDVAWYLHFMRGSVAVEVGDRVDPSTMLGYIGSSGCSTWPHLHFELHDAANAVVDPFLTRRWASPPEYDPPLRVMEPYIHATRLDAIDTVRDSPSSATSVRAGTQIGLSVICSGGTVGTTLTIEVTNEAGANVLTFGRVWDQIERQTLWWWNRTVTGDPGTYTMRYSANGIPLGSTTFTLTP